MAIVGIGAIASIGNMGNAGAGAVAVKHIAAVASIRLVPAIANLDSLIVIADLHCVTETVVGVSAGRTIDINAGAGTGAIAIEQVGAAAAIGFCPAIADLDSLGVVDFVSVTAIRRLPEIFRQQAIGTVCFHVGVAQSVNRIRALAAIGKLELRDHLVARRSVRGIVFYQCCVALCAIFDEQICALLKKLGVPRSDAVAELDRITHGSAVYGVVSITLIDHERIVPAPCIECIVARATHQCVVAAGAEHHVAVDARYGCGDGVGLRHQLGEGENATVRKCKAVDRADHAVVYSDGTAVVILNQQGRIAGS